MVHQSGSHCKDADGDIRGERREIRLEFVEEEQDGKETSGQGQCMGMMAQRSSY
jgi:hypothetical protein